MTKTHLIPVMDASTRTILVFLTACINFVSGQSLPRPERLEVDILDGEVTAFWQHPAKAPSNFQYNVQMAKHSEEWDKVPSCTRITDIYCDLSSLIKDYRTGYKVKVQLVAGMNESAWTMKKFLPSASKLQPPSFIVQATSSSLTVNVVQKPILKKLFPYGVTYTIYLEERGKHNQTTTAYLTVAPEEDKTTKAFHSLHWGTEYCVSVMVEGVGSLSASRPSKQCLHLSEQEWYITAVTALSALGVLAFAVAMVTIALCYLRRPEKTPVALKSPASGWHPLSVGEGAVEIVTDKGWFLSTYATQREDCTEVPVTIITVTEDSEEEDRRTSMDSGVSMESNSIENSPERPSMRQDDSGCGSLGGQESSTSSQTTYPLQQEGTQTGITRDRGDSGVGLGCQLHSSSLDLKEQDSGPLKEAVYGGNYRSQRTPDVETDVCEEKEVFSQMHCDPSLAEVVKGYRAGPQSCICSGAGQCTWCHKNAPHGTQIIKQYRATCTDSRLQSGKCNSVDTYKGITFALFPTEAEMDSVIVDDLKTTFTKISETFPMLSALTPLSLVEGGQDINMNNLSLSLCDVQLTTD